MNPLGLRKYIFCLPLVLLTALPSRGADDNGPSDASKVQQNAVKSPDSDQAKEQGNTPILVSSMSGSVGIGFLTAVGRAESAIARADKLTAMADRAARQIAPVQEPALPILTAASVTVPLSSGDPALDRLIDTCAIKYNLMPDLVRALIKVESNFNPRAISPKGAQGLMQLMPETAQRYGVRNIFDSGDNISGGVHYLSDLLKMFNGNIPLALSAYNAGENLITKIQAIPNYPETRDYVTRIASLFDFRRSPYLQMP